MSAWAPGAWAPGAWAGTAWAEGAPVEVPDVVGLAQADAITALEGAGFVVVVTTAASSLVAIGLVISQVPPGGSFATEGATVTIVVSTGDVIPVDPLLLGKKKKKANQNIKFKPAREAGEQEERTPDEIKPEPPKKRASGLLLGLLARAELPKPVEAVAVEPAAAPAPLVQASPMVVAAAPAEAAPAAAVPAPAVEPTAELVGRLMARIEALEGTVVDLLGALDRKVSDLQHELSLTLPVETPSQTPQASPAPAAPVKLTGEALAKENRRRARILAQQLLG